MTATVASQSIEEIQQTQDNFKIFADLVNQQLLKMSATELYKTETTDIFETYLSFFPEGTDPIFRERTSHDCNCCKQFVRNLGTVVSIVNNKIVTVWDVEGAPYPYNEIAENMAEYVRNSQIVNVYRTKMTQYGYEKNVDSYDRNIIWRHFYGKVPSRSVKMDPGPELARFTAAHQVLSRGLQEFTLADIEEVLDLIDQNAIYRGAEFRKSIVAFQELKTKYQKAKDKELFVWENVGHPQAGFRNTAIGSLFIDLAAGDDIETAVRKFETKVAPTNYKRPTALITPKMIEQAVTTLKSLNLEDAIERRHARFEDISVNDVLFVDNSVAGKMKGGLTDLLMESATQKLPKSYTPIRIEDFMAMNHKNISLVIKGNQQGNFVSLTAPVHNDVNQLFKWSNNFAWSYDGDVTDSIKERVAKAGGNVTTAKLRCSLAWFNYDDLDIHCYTPTKQHIYYATKQGILDVDMNAGGRHSRTPVENLSWTKIVDGVYNICVDNFCKRETIDHGCVIQVEFDGQVHEFKYEKTVGRNVPMLDITVENGKMTAIKTHPGVTGGSEIKVEKWGVSTNTPVKVNTIMLSPNHWEGTDKTGNKHWFFILENCLNPVPTRGIYNEFLNPILEPHRKVFEVLGTKTKCPFSEQQLSGVGFSSTRKDKVLAIADKKAFEIHF